MAGGKQGWRAIVNLLLATRYLLPAFNDCRKGMVCSWK
jgi:hypothetical protein